MMKEAFTGGASDIHLSAGLPFVLRKDGLLVRMGETRLTVGDMDAMTNQVMPEARKAEFHNRGEVDFAYSLHGYGRFRVNVYKQRGTNAIALRLIPESITGIRDLKLPDGVSATLTALSQKPNGLVLLTGPTGSGKSTTLAAMIDMINEERPVHIITLEDPIEFLHKHKKAVVNQREIGDDCQSFARGLRAALRQDPDVILLGEMRDIETIQTAMEAAETGHLVFATLHTNSASATVERIIDVFPANQQAQVRVQLAGTLQGVVTQRLFKRRNGPGRFGAAEVLVVTPAVRNLIRESKTHQIYSQIQTGARLGMRTMESSVKELHQRQIINDEDLKLFMEETAQNNLSQMAANGAANPQLRR